MKELTNKLQERIIKILMKKYPITTDELVKEIGMRKDVVQKEIKKLEREGVIALEVLPDKIFVRLLRRDFMFFNEKKIDRNIIVEQENLKNLKKNAENNAAYI
ncbi:MAG: transcriptional regulator [Candidatus Altiarchaeales archaeon HGW-Altiarchaeales-2]|nr:MAG: transcriptional regulator [Candidatus Altiarchaeales archaeon HGW-Altiarchaeales-2]